MIVISLLFIGGSKTMETEEITRVATQQEVNKYLEMLTTVHFLGDQADLDYKRAIADVNATHSEIQAAYHHKQAIEAQYMRLSDWLWANTPHGVCFNHEEQRYFVR